MSEISEIQESMGEVYKAWLSASADECAKNQKRYEAAKAANIGWEICSFKPAKNKWPTEAEAWKGFKK